MMLRGKSTYSFIAPLTAFFFAGFFPLGVTGSHRASVEELDVRSDGTVHSGDLRVRRINDEILIGCVSAVAMAHPELAGGELERRAGERDARPGARKPRPQQRVDALRTIRCRLRLDELRVRIRFR